MKICLQCNNTVSEDAVFCPKCGDNLNLQKQINICKKCNKENPDEAIFCIQCGDNLKKQNELKICPMCSKENSNDVLFCMQCGHNMSQPKKEPIIIMLPKENENAANQSIDIINKNVANQSVDIINENAVNLSTDIIYGNVVNQSVDIINENVVNLSTGTMYENVEPTKVTNYTYQDDAVDDDNIILYNSIKPNINKKFEEKWSLSKAEIIDDLDDVNNIDSTIQIKTEQQIETENIVNEVLRTVREDKISVPIITDLTDNENTSPVPTKRSGKIKKQFLPKVAPTISHKICPKCNIENSNRERFCTDCGSSLGTSILQEQLRNKLINNTLENESQSKHCPKCDRINSPDKRFCTWCGANIK